MIAPAGGHGLVGVADAGVFLTRLLRLDPSAPVRLRSTGGHTVLWARLPWDVLVSRSVAGAGPGDATVRCDELLAELSSAGDALPRRRDADWRWPLPPAGGRVVETVPVAELSRLAVAAAGTLRAAAARGVAGRRVGERVLRDALLDHVALVVTDPERVEVPQRLVQAVSRMGFLGDAAQSAQVVRAGRWVSISAPYGAAWLQSAKNLTVRPLDGNPNG